MAKNRYDNEGYRICYCGKSMYIQDKGWLCHYCNRKYKSIVLEEMYKEFVSRISKIFFPEEEV